jgi:methyl-accepting chemotaxis protein
MPAAQRTDSAGTSPSALDALAEAAVTLSHDIVDIAGFLDGVDALARAQGQDLNRARTSARAVAQASRTMAGASERTGQAVADVAQSVIDSSARVQGALGASEEVMRWVSGAGPRMETIGGIVGKVRQSNGQISEISREVNILAVNARIEAARAGEAGRGFIVVADAINALSRQTSQAAETISETVRLLAQELSALTGEAVQVSQRARGGLAGLTEAEGALRRMEAQAASGQAAAGEIAAGIEEVRLALADFGPALRALFDGVTQQAAKVNEAQRRAGSLIQQGETMVERTVELGGATSDRPMIEAVQAGAARLAEALEGAVARGEISLTALFDRTYVPVPGSNPAQVVAPYTALTDRLFPPVQEAALVLDPRIVFCAAVDRNGYLPTHNRKFSQPQGLDPVWNAANCRNRRIFDDRVGLGAGQSMAPFLLQVYRRDMGGGQFAMMKDVSAPILVRGRHWGGLRLAYRF